MLQSEIVCSVSRHNPCKRNLYIYDGRQIFGGAFEAMLVLTKKEDRRSSILPHSEYIASDQSALTQAPMDAVLTT
jgi:hypothetical protein